MLLWLVRALSRAFAPSDAAVILRRPGAASFSRTQLSWCPSEIAQHRRHAGATVVPHHDQIGECHGRVYDYATQQNCR